MCKNSTEKTSCDNAANEIMFYKPISSAYYPV